jgi:predicted extracellular nuclease
VKTGGKMKTTMITFLRIFVGLGFILSLIGGSNSSVKAAPALDLFFSEYIEGSSNNKALEIYNLTAGVSISQQIVTISRCSSTVTQAPA